MFETQFSRLFPLPKMIEKYVSVSWKVEIRSSLFITSQKLHENLLYNKVS